MRLPKRKIKVLVVDDQAREIHTMLTVLANWNRVTLEILVATMDSINSMVKVIEIINPDILLIDEGLGDNIVGSFVVQKLKKNGWSGEIVSITASSQSISIPNIFQNEQIFQNKQDICHQKIYTEEFIRFMNEAIIRYENKK